MDPAAFAALISRCAPGAATEPLAAILRQTSSFEPLLITIGGRKPISVQAMSLEEGVRLATEATVAGQSRTRLRTDTPTRKIRMCSSGLRCSSE